jgi:hypothetical protein
MSQLQLEMKLMIEEKKKKKEGVTLTPNLTHYSPHSHPPPLHPADHRQGRLPL